MKPDQLLMIPGPVMLTEEVIRALAQPTVSHHDPDYNAVLDECIEFLRHIFDTDGLVAILPGSGRLGLEAAISSLIRPGDRSLHLVNGFFADWMVEMAQRAGARVTVLNVAWEQVLSGETLRRALDEARQASQLYTLVTAVHSETSTGQLNPVGELGAICREFDTLLLADAISSLGCAPLSMARDNIDLCVTASQKGLCAPLGLSAVAVGERALAVMARKGPAQSYVLDLARWQKFFAAPVPRPYPIVPSPHLVLALHASLQQIHAEGLSQRFKRHQQIAAATRSGLMALGLDCFAAVPSPSVTAFKIPAGLTGSDIIQRMVKEHNVQVAGGMGELAGRLIRISHIGRQATPELQLRTLQAVAAVLKGLGHPCDSLHAERTFRSTYQA